MERTGTPDRDAHVELGGYGYSGAIFAFGVPIVVASALLLGRTTTVYYDPDDPSNATDGSARWLSYVALPISAGMLFALFGVTKAEIRGRKARYKRGEEERQGSRQAYWDGERWTW